MVVERNIHPLIESFVSSPSETDLLKAYKVFFQLTSLQQKKVIFKAIKKLENGDKFTRAIEKDWFEYISIEGHL